MVSCLPVRAGSRTVKDSLAQLTALGKSVFFSWVDTGLQNVFSSVLKMVRSLSSEKPPDFSVGNDPLFLTCKARAENFFFIQFKPVDAPKTMLVGRQAVQQVFITLMMDKNTGKKITMERLRPLLTYSWLMSDSDVLRLHTLVDQVQPKAAVDAGAASSSKDGAKKPAGKAGAKAMVSKLFQKKSK